MSYDQKLQLRIIYFTLDYFCSCAYYQDLNVEIWRDIRRMFSIESDLMKVNNFFELRMIWELCMVNHSPKGIHFHEICV